MNENVFQILVIQYANINNTVTLKQYLLGGQFDGSYSLSHRLLVSFNEPAMNLSTGIYHWKITCIWRFFHSGLAFSLWCYSLPHWHFYNDLIAGNILQFVKYLEVCMCTGWTRKPDEIVFKSL